jgi:ion channel-forming bestrophin family protein
MHIGEYYKLRELLNWTRKEILILSVLAIIPTVLYQVLNWKWMALPWSPIATVGTAAAFLLAFRNNSTYDRLWEARIVWGAITNLSRAWGIQVRDMIVSDDPDIRDFKIGLVRRHIAWLTALRFQLREKRIWERMEKPHNRRYLKFYHVPEWGSDLGSEIRRHLADFQWSQVKETRNVAAQIIALQSADLNYAFDRGWLDSFRFSQLMETLSRLYDEQGKCERIKDTPYPRQFAMLNLSFIRVFIVMIPFGLLQEFARVGETAVWLTVPISFVVTWIIHCIEKIGEHSENPFQGGPDDTPMASIARNVEIDLKEMIRDSAIPAPLKPKNSIIM